VAGRVSKGHTASDRNRRRQIDETRHRTNDREHVEASHEQQKDTSHTQSSIRYSI
jgi:hypothetical protein